MMENSADTVAASGEMFADRQAIIDLTVAYTWALDQRNLEELRNVFTANATAELRGVRCDGVDGIIARISAAVNRLDATQHLIGNHQVVIEGDTASCRCQLHSQHVKVGTEGGENFVIGGVYEDQLTRTEVGWRISHRVMRQSWSEGNPAVVARSAS